MGLASLLGLVWCFCTVLPLAKADDWPPVDVVYNAVEKVLNFFEKDHESLLIDALAGIRMAEGQFTVAVEKLKPENDKPSPWHSKMSSLLQRVQRLASLVNSDAKNRSSGYDKQMGVVVTRPFYATSSLDRETDPQLAWNHGKNLWPKSNKLMMSDRCLSSLANRTNGRSCHVDDDCWKAMTAFEVSGYWLTHEVIYLILGRTFGCLESMEGRVTEKQVSIGHLEDVLCSNVHMEMVEKFPVWIEPGMGEDLFMEQGAVCGMLGFRNVLKSEWLNFTLHLQRDSGCLGPSDGRHFDDEQPDGDTADVKGAHNRTHRRRLLAEIELENNCMVHMSSVGLGLFSVYLRHLVLLETQSQISDVDQDFSLKDTSPSTWVAVYSVCAAVAVLLLIILMVRPSFCFRYKKTTRVL
eukprot:m.310751 g.310751  ORF g.310751 m.310751 type:complete len:409 (+) comp54467_c0_seq1:41-1267(+)